MDLDKSGTGQGQVMLNKYRGRHQSNSVTKLRNIDVYQLAETNISQKHLFYFILYEDIEFCTYQLFCTWLFRDSYIKTANSLCLERNRIKREDDLLSISYLLLAVLASTSNVLHLLT